MVDVFAWLTIGLFGGMSAFYGWTIWRYDKMTASYGEMAERTTELNAELTTAIERMSLNMMAVIDETVAEATKDMELKPEDLVIWQVVRNALVRQAGTP